MGTVTPAKLGQIRRMRRQGFTLAAIARTVDVGLGEVRRALKAPAARSAAESRQRRREQSIGELRAEGFGEEVIAACFGRMR